MCLPPSKHTYLSLKSLNCHSYLPRLPGRFYCIISLRTPHASQRCGPRGVFFYALSQKVCATFVPLLAKKVANSHLLGKGSKAEKPCKIRLLRGSSLLGVWVQVPPAAPTQSLINQGFQGFSKLPCATRVPLFSRQRKRADSCDRLFQTDD